MARLSAPFSLQDVKDEFCSDTNAALPNPNSMRDMYEKIFGSASAGDRLSDFGNTGKPTVQPGFLELSNFTSSTVDITVDVTDTGGLETTIVAKYEEGGSFGGNAQYQNLGSVTLSGEVTLTLSNLTADTNYIVDVGIYNNYNDGFTSCYVYTNANETFKTETTSTSGDYIYDPPKVEYEQPTDVSFTEFDTFVTVTVSWDETSDADQYFNNGIYIVVNFSDGSQQVDKKETTWADGSDSISFNKASGVTVQDATGAIADVGITTYYGDQLTQT